ncbi:MAG TPA: zinc-binding dehydrogenase [Candidatus Limnocylindrales bacterium]|nr:zinc-binding dehydrogenase [Candidatus Limnocylindrales bacterium]
MATSTRGLVFGGAQRPLEIEELLLDEPQSGEVLVRMVASGVCHSDLHVVDGEWERPATVVLGHEGAAIVEALGPDVPADGPKERDLVVLAWTAPCGSCIACQRAQPWLCIQPRGGGHRLGNEDVRLRRADGTPVGVYSGIGTFGERQVVAHQAAIPVDPRTPPELAALIGCAVTTGFGAVVNTAGVRAGESVVVIGAGGVGLSAVMGARFADAGVIAVIDTNPEKLELARSAGATHVFQPPEADAIGDLTDGGADHVLEAIGLTETVEQAVELVRPGGIVTLVGMTPQGRRAGIDVYRFVEDGKQLRGSNYGSATPAIDFPRIAALYADGRLPLDLLVTERIGLEGVERALGAMRRGDGARRVVVYQ